MEFTVTMKCGDCGEKFAGQGEHLVDAVSTMVASAYQAGHAHDRLNQELEALSQKAEGVNAVSSVLGVLGLEPSEVKVHIIDDESVMTQKEFQEFIQKHRDGDKPDGQD